MREIKFRAISKRTGEFVFGDLLTKDVHHGFAINESGCVIHPVKPETIGQYTGFHDYKGNDIYVGDKIKLYKSTYVVVFFEGCFLKRQITGRISKRSRHFFLSSLKSNGKIIGNIHQNPELL